jgi:hypothetical protein
MASIFTLVKPDNTKDPTNLPYSEKLRREISSNWVQKLLTYKGYVNFIEAPESTVYIFDETVRKAYRYQTALFNIKRETNNGMSSILLQSLVYGTMNTTILDNIIIESKTNEKIKVFKLSEYVCLYGIKGRDKIFGCAIRGPGHSTFKNNSYEWEKKVWLPKYYKSIENMKKEIEAIVNQNHNAIIILMSDHGPYLLVRNAEERQKKPYYTLFRDTYGAFMAIRWPDKEKASKFDKDFNVTQDLFPIILAYLYDDHILLKYKIKDTSVRLADHKFDKGIVYPNYYKKNGKESYWATF